MSKENIAWLGFGLLLTTLFVIGITLIFFVKGYFLAVGLTVLSIMGIFIVASVYDYLNEKYNGFEKKEIQ
ncbi:hypothetical protein KDN24_05490 [Bacillus sp. Bva_UNVM-123]|uniref:hypothetical protein n=1 Tax=Bacillus sp. Bva_UNVM-123 TaxID=2829798 RepID=UPI00391F417E